VNRLYRRWELPESVIEDGERVRIEKRRAMPVDGRVFVIELELTSSPP
jgi:hypothetical protein